jgi:hypothetical protein
MNKFIKWQNQESSKRRRLLFLGMGALVFPISIPAVLILVLPQVDRTIGLYIYWDNFNNNRWLPRSLDNICPNKIGVGITFSNDAH